MFLLYVSSQVRWSFLWGSFHVYRPLFGINFSICMSQHSTFFSCIQASFGRSLFVYGWHFSYMYTSFPIYMPLLVGFFSYICMSLLVGLFLYMWTSFHICRSLFCKCPFICRSQHRTHFSYTRVSFGRSPFTCVGLFFVVCSSVAHNKALSFYMQAFFHTCWSLFVHVGLFSYVQASFL